MLLPYKQLNNSIWYKVELCRRYFFQIIFVQFQNGCIIVKLRRKMRNSSIKTISVQGFIITATFLWTWKYPGNAENKIYFQKLHLFSKMYFFVNFQGTILVSRFHEYSNWRTSQPLFLLSTHLIGEMYYFWMWDLKGFYDFFTAY